MKEFRTNKLYIEDIQFVLNLPLNWDRLKNKSFMIAGASGLIGCFLVDVLMSANLQKDLNCKVYALGRNSNNAQSRFAEYWNSTAFEFVACDINNDICINVPQIDYVFHFASNTHPLAYSTDPIGTIESNIIGTRNLLEFSVSHNVERFVFASSVEIYGESRNEDDCFDESYCGYIDCNSLRAGYPESKRAGEALCQAYIKQKNLNVVIPRLSRVYGPTMLSTDSKALSQFLKKGLNNEDIVLKSKGDQYFSYCHVTDAISGILWCLIFGECGEAYNIVGDNSDIRLRDLAKIIADHVKRHVVFELPDATEQAGYSKSTRAILNNKKLKSLGWYSIYDINIGVTRTLDILQ